MRLSDQYRPQTWGEIIGQEKALAKIEALRKRGLGGRAMFLTGASGTGKTSIAKLLCAEHADDWSIEPDIDAASLTPAKLSELERSLHHRGLGRPGRACIVNEAHRLREDTIGKLLDVMERIPAHVLWCFTTTRAGAANLFGDHDDAMPFVSRCEKIDLTIQGLAKPMAARLLEIAREAGMDGRPIEDYVKLIQRHHNNMRGALSDIEAGCMKAD